MCAAVSLSLLPRASDELHGRLEVETCGSCSTSLCWLSPLEAVAPYQRDAHLLHLNQGYQRTPFKDDCQAQADLWFCLGAASSSSHRADSTQGNPSDGKPAP